MQGLSLGYIYRTKARIQQIQAGASSGNSRYTFYLTPILVIERTLQSYGFTGTWTIIQPQQPSATPTKVGPLYNTLLGIPATSVIIKYQGHTYKIVLEQLATKRGTGGIWLIWQVGPQLT